MKCSVCFVAVFSNKNAGICTISISQNLLYKRYLELLSFFFCDSYLLILSGRLLRWVFLNIAKKYITYTFEVSNHKKSGGSFRMINVITPWVEKMVVFFIANIVAKDFQVRRNQTNLTSNCILMVPIVKTWAFLRSPNHFTTVGNHHPLDQ